MLNLQKAHQIIENELKNMEIPGDPKNLYDPVRYILSNGGKRIRPIIVLLTANMFTDEISNAIKPALGLEIFHNFTLLHDDLMDESNVRRGNKTVHIKWDPNIAILSGDVMSIIAGQLISESKAEKSVEMLRVFNKTAIEVCEGQMMDMDFEERSDVSIEEYLEMIKLKTSVLLAASFQIGALAGNSSMEESELLYEFGLNLGLAFQLQDDYLDTFGDVETFGKKIGTDILNNKKTFLLINALNLAEEKQKTILNQYIEDVSINPDEKIKAVVDIFKSCQTDKITSEKISWYFEKAMKKLQEINLPEQKKQVILELVNSLKSREF